MAINLYMYELRIFNDMFREYNYRLQTGIAITVPILGVLLLLIAILLCIFKQRMAKRRTAANVTKTDENATYGDYFDPDQRMEVEDSNAYYSSDYEAGTSRTTDNNPYYE